MQDALRASPAEIPPQNMHRAIIFNGVWTLAITMFIFPFRGRQVRRELDEQKNEEQKTLSIGMNRMAALPSQDEPLEKS